MPDNVSASLLVQLEAIDGQLISARLLAPWRSHVVGRNWAEIEPRLIAKAQQELTRASPRKWLASDRLRDLPEVHLLRLELPPAERGLDWQRPIEFTLQLFRWEFETDGMAQVLVPAVKCELFARSDQLTDQVISEQVHTALLRLGDGYDLLDVRNRFFQRSFEYRLVTFETPLAGSTKRSSSRAADSSDATRKKTSTLQSTSSNLFRAELEPVFGRQQQVMDVAEYLMGQTPQSVLLVGPAGVGKTAIVHDLVHRIRDAAPDSPLATLKGRTIWSTTGSRLVSGMSGLGMWQDRCLKLIREAHDTQAIVHVGSAVELMEAGKIEGQPGVASMIRQAVSRGRLLIIAECTPEQVAIVQRDEPLLLRALVRYDVTEPSHAEVTQILDQAAQYRTTLSTRKASQRCRFTPAAIEELHRLHRRYASYSALPAQPLRLMQTVLEQAAPGATIEASHIARAFAAQTGLPRFLVDDAITVDLDRIRTRLAAHVIGQPEPVDLVVNLIATLKSRMVRPGRPLASLLFIGPTGVGKTEMAKAIAGLLYSDTRRMVRIDMSEYASPWAAVRLIGRPDEGDGTLTSPIREQPFSVVLLDEFEKADPAVFDMLLQLLGDGRLTDSMGRLADFRNAVVIMTSNLGVESFRESGFGFGETGGDWRSHFEREVQRFVRPELLGRIDRIVPFAPLPRKIVRQIAQREVELLKERPGLKYAELELKVDDEVIDRLCELGYQPKYGARPLRRAIEQLMTVPLANCLAQLPDRNAWTLRATLVDNVISVDAARMQHKHPEERRTAETAIDAWQALGRMARLAQACTPLRDLQNETERLRRINDSLFDKLKETTQSRRANFLKLEIQENAVTIERNQRLAEAVQTISDQIIAAHKSILLDWYRNVALDHDQLFDQAEQMRDQLRDAIVGLTEGRSKNLENVTVIIIGKPLSRAAVLWQAYESIASNNKWKIDHFTLRTYDPLRDRQSVEYRKRQSQRKASVADQGPESEPAMRLLARAPGTEGDATVKICDVYRDANSQHWTDADPTVAGVALQLAGFGVSAWLGNEHGMMHFVDSSATGPKRRLRFRVLVEPKRMFDVPLGVNWTDLVAPPQRDPRRTFHVVENVISDGLRDAQFDCGHDSLTECLTEAIRADRENDLWQAIEFTGIPEAARVSQAESNGTPR